MTEEQVKAQRQAIINAIIFAHVMKCLAKLPDLTPGYVSLQELETMGLAPRKEII